MADRHMPSYYINIIDITEKSMGRGRKRKTIKMKNRKRQVAKKASAKKRGETVRKSRASK